MGKMYNVWYAELYAPVSTYTDEKREEFYVYAAEAITAMRMKDPNLPMIVLGDLNVHINGHYSTTTNDNGKLIKSIAKEEGLTLINMNSPTHHQTGRGSHAYTT